MKSYTSKFHSHPCNILYFVLSYLIFNEMHCHSKDSFIFVDWEKKDRKHMITRASELWNRIFSKRKSKAFPRTPLLGCIGASLILIYLTSTS